MTSNCLYLYDVLCWTCRSRRSTSVPLRATSSGVLLSLFFKLTSAPLSINIRVASVLLLRAAQCNGVFSYRVCMFISAPSCSRCLMTSVRLNIVAQWRVAKPTPLLTSTGTLSLTIRSIVVTSPSITAWRKLRTSCRSVSRYEKRLHAN